MAFDEIVASVTLTGSLLSLIATTCVIVSFAFYHKEQRSFRHALVLNLTLAEFINSLDNSISGIVFVRDRTLQPGLPCALNGLLGQISVQAADFSILAIALVTLVTVTRQAYMPGASRTAKTLVCLSVWLVPVATGTVAAGMGQMVPVGTNWCWISGDRSDLRYALAHGWRYVIIFSTILIYIYIYWYMRRHFRSTVSALRTGWSNLGSSAQGSSSSLPRENAHNKGKAGSTSSLGSFGRRSTEDLAVDDEKRSLPSTPRTPDKVQLADSTRTRKSKDAGFGIGSFYDSDDEEDVKGEKPTAGRERQSSRGSRHGPTGAGRMPPPPAIVVADAKKDESGLEAGSLSESDDDVEEAATSSPPPPPQQLNGRQSPGRGNGAGRKKGRMSTVATVAFCLPPLSPRGPVSRVDQYSSPICSPLRSPMRSPLKSPRSPLPIWTENGKHQQYRPYRANRATVGSEFPIRQATRQVDREIKRMMLLNAYPIAYIILWIPALINRMMEASGHPATGRTAQALQASSQFIGFANALTYGFNRHIRHRIKGDLFGRWRK